MADDKMQKRPQDALRVNIDEDHEVQYWSRKFSVTRAQLVAAVNKVGVMAADVEKELTAA
jgi:hypothetical protein